MPLDPHDLPHDFPEFAERIEQLKAQGDGLFCSLMAEYDTLDKQVHRIEQGVEAHADDFTEELKKRRMQLKDRLYALLKE